MGQIRYSLVRMLTLPQTDGKLNFACCLDIMGLSNQALWSAAVNPLVAFREALPISISFLFRSREKTLSNSCGAPIGVNFTKATRETISRS